MTPLLTVHLLQNLLLAYTLWSRIELLSIVSWTWLLRCLHIGFAWVRSAPILPVKSVQAYRLLPVQAIQPMLAIAKVTGVD